MKANISQSTLDILAKECVNTAYAVLSPDASATQCRVAIIEIATMIAATFGSEGIQSYLNQFGEDRNRAEMNAQAALVAPATKPSPSMSSVDALLLMLDTLARDFEANNYGLPLHDDPVRNDMRREVLSWLNWINEAQS